MKKTIIALLALAGVAGAAEPQSWDLQVYTNDTGTTADLLTTGNGNFQFDSTTPLTTYAFDFTATTLDKYGNGNDGYTFTLFSTSRGTENAREGLGVYSNATKGTYGNETGAVTVGISDGTTMKSTSTLLIEEGDSVSFAYDSMSKTALLYNITSKALVEVTLAENKESYYFESGTSKANTGASAVYTQSGAHQLTFGQVTDLTSMAGNVQAIKSYIGVVPEPTTATLSLLALAGLAARRRRK